MMRFFHHTLSCGVNKNVLWRNGHALVEFMPVSSENRILSDNIMGVETPIPPIMICAAAPDEAPPRRINE
jgi:hypothetical protein